MTKKKPTKQPKRPSNNRVDIDPTSFITAPRSAFTKESVGLNSYWSLRAKEIAVRAIYAGILKNFQAANCWEDFKDWIAKSRMCLQGVEIAHAVSDAAMITKAGREGDCRKELDSYQAVILLFADLLKEHLDAETKAEGQSS